MRRGCASVRICGGELIYVYEHPPSCGSDLQIVNGRPHERLDDSPAFYLVEAGTVLQRREEGQLRHPLTVAHSIAGRCFKRSYSDGARKCTDLKNCSGGLPFSSSPSACRTREWAPSQANSTLPSSSSVGVVAACASLVPTRLFALRSSTDDRRASTCTPPPKGWLNTVHSYPKSSLEPAAGASRSASSLSSASRPG
eukprot:scaffold907_cov120-Isochrysis_galbana.AAC.2